MLSKFDYQPLLEKVKKHIEQALAVSDNAHFWDEFLDDYSKLSILCDKATNLVLLEGEAYEFPLPPVYVYLLPHEVEGMRWLLATFVTEEGESQVQILTWQITQGKAYLAPLANQPPQLLKNCDSSLDSRPISIDFRMGRRNCSVELVFPQGELELIVSADLGIKASSWTNKNHNNEPWTERCSARDMPALLQVLRYAPNQSWRDDRVLDLNGKVISGDSAELGRIHGADAWGEPPSRAYLASSRGRVYRLDLDSPGKTPIASQIMSNEIKDLLVLPDPDSPEKYIVLAAIQRAALVSFHESPDLQPKVSHWQYSGRSILQLIGRGDAHFLAYDERGRLSPLLLSNPDTLRNLRNQSIELLAKRFLEAQGHKVGTSTPFVVPIDFRYRILLALDSFLQDAPTDRKLQGLRELNSILQVAYQRADALQLAELSRLHYDLIRRIRRWLANKVFSPSKLRLEPEHLDHLLEILTPPISAADALWTALFRHYDWLWLWAKKAELEDDSKFRPHLERFNTAIQRQRYAMLPDLDLIRPLNTLASRRFLHHVMDIEVLDETQNLVALLNAIGDLYLFKIDAHGKAWQQLHALEGDNRPGQGQPMFIRRLPTSSGQKLLLGTLRGELMVLDWHGERLRVQKSNLDCGFAPNCCQKVNDRYLLLGGRDRDGRACLYGLPDPFDPRKGLRRLWCDEDKCIGSIRMLRYSDQDRRLFAIDNKRGRLYAWDIELQPGRPHLISNLPQPRLWLSGAHRLHGMDYSEKHSMVVCGGHGGLTVALDAATGALRWVLNGVGNLWRIRYLPFHPPEGAWLLCGDDHSSLLASSDGDILSVIEKAGPVASTAIYGKGLMLGTQDGRLVLMGSSELLPEHGAPTMNRQPWQSQAYLATHPLRALRFCSAYEFSVADFDGVSLDESLPALAILRRCADHLTAIAADTEVCARFFEFFFAQSRERQVVFLYWLRECCRKAVGRAESFNQIALQLLQAIWQGLLKGLLDNDSGLICKMVAPMLDILDMLPVEQARNQRKAILDVLWQTTSENKLPLSLRSASTTIRLNRAIDAWRILPSTLNDVQRLFAWCNAISKECDAKSEEGLRSALNSLFSSHLRLLTHDNPWQTWLNDSVSATPADLLPLPPPLTLLQHPQNWPLATADENALKNILPDNTVWMRWLDNLKNILQAVQQTANHVPHNAWRERNAWLRLREHFEVQGRELFAVDDQALPMLWWSSLTVPWGKFVNDALRALLQRVQEQPEAYLVLTLQDRWHDSDRIELNLSLTNRLPYRLELDAIYWNHRLLSIDGLPIALRVDGGAVDCKTLLAVDDNKPIEGRLQLHCHDMESGQKIVFSYDKSIARDLSMFFAKPQWRETKERLQAFLKSRTAFGWLDGTFWSNEERRRLKAEVTRIYGVRPDTDMAYRANDETQPLFSPDLALGADPAVWVEQLHCLLPIIASNEREVLALSIWRWAKKLPPGIDDALGDALYRSDQIESRLLRLWGNPNDLQRLKQALHRLPSRALGAWCGDEPFYAARKGESRRVDEWYLPVASLLGGKLWALLDDRVKSADDLAALTEVSPAQAEEQRRNRHTLRHIDDIEPERQLIRPAAIEALANAILMRLGPGAVHLQKEAWYLDAMLTLNWIDYQRCYLLPKATAIKRATLTKLPPGLWLCLGVNDPPKDLPGIALALSAENALALLHAETPDDAIRILNKIAAPQHAMQPSLVFRSAGGLGPLVERHFGGREQEINSIWQCLHDADRPQGRSGVLLVGGRRMGKTCVREKILAEVTKHESERVCLFINCEGMPDDLDGIELEHWFFGELAQSLQLQRKPLHYSWPSRDKNHKPTRAAARQSLRDHLQKIRGASAKTTLLIFDETDYLVRADYLDTTVAASRKQFLGDSGDTANRYKLFQFLRSLVHEGLLCLIATAYPYGAGQEGALNIENYNSGSPLYNTFNLVIRLDSWSPETAWSYLYSRLSGLGVVLPYHYREDILSISRGIPWIVHAFGLALCNLLPREGRGAKVVNESTWSLARRAILQEIFVVMKVSVEDAAQRQDALSNLDPTRHPDGALGGGRLWRALCEVARRASALPHLDDSSWPGATRFSLKEVQDRLPNIPHSALQAALHRLMASAALEGIESEADSHRFANNLLPIWLLYEEKEKS